jgi:transposase
VAGSNRIERGRLPHTPEALHDWAEELRRRFAGKPVGILLEQKRGALVWALQEHSFLTLFPINPLTSAKLRQAFFPSGAKSDPADSDLLLDILRHHRDRLRPLQWDEVETRLLERLTEDRRDAVEHRKSCVQQLTAALKEYFPLALEVAGALEHDMAAHFLLKWGSLEELQAVRPHLLRKFFHGHNGRFQIEERLEQIKKARALTTDAAIVEAGRRKVQMLAQIILTLNQSISDYENRIETLFKRHPDRHIFESFPGAGAALAPRLLTAFGMDRSAYPTAVHVQNKCGIAPVRISSGKMVMEQMRVRCPKFLRQSFHEFAAISVRYSTWARAYYQAKKAAGKAHHTIVRALAYKWIRIMWACWQNQQPYEEARYLKALRLSGSPFALTPKST